MDGYFFGDKAKFRRLFFASILLLFTLLGSRELWTQEIRWANIVSGMLYRNDYFHPYLGDQIYYDKPLFSYWLMVFLAAIRGTLTTWELRLPSALAGLLTIWSIYRLGSKIKDQSLGLLSGWMLLTTYYFVFWSRICSADMLNVAGSLLAVTWYIDKREETRSLDYVIFFQIIAFTSLCKGLIAVIVPCIAVGTDIILQRSWRKHIKLSTFLSILPALFVYLLPFLASAYFNRTINQQNGLYAVYRENFLRYFKPFDHHESFYIYFIYLPIYLLPWSFFFIAALISIKSRFKSMAVYAKWLTWTMFLLFLFFTLSGSRRSYYVLPIVPFAILMTADWLLSVSSFWRNRNQWISWYMIFAFMLLFLCLVLVPAWYYVHFGAQKFIEHVKKEAVKESPWATWRIVLLDAKSKMNFYLHLRPTTKDLSLNNALPIIKINPTHTIFISRKCNQRLLQSWFSHYKMLEGPKLFVHFPFLKKENENMPIAFMVN